MSSSTHVLESRVLAPHGHFHRTVSWTRRINLKLSTRARASTSIVSEKESVSNNWLYARNSRRRLKHSTPPEQHNDKTVNHKFWVCVSVHHSVSQMKHQLDATLCRFYFCRVTLHVSDASAHHQEYLKLVLLLVRPPLWSSGQSFWLQIHWSRVRFPALPDFLRGSGSGTGCTQPREPREVNWGATWIK